MSRESVVRVILLTGAETVKWAQEILQSPIAIRCLKAAFNADCDAQAGLQELALLYDRRRSRRKTGFFRKTSP